METGYLGTFVISWAQTELDGVRGGGPELALTGASWRWTGEAVRLEGAVGPLALEGALGRADMHRRAARVVGRLVGAALRHSSPDPEPEPEAEQDDPPLPGFVLTDGRRSYGASLIQVPDTGSRLVMFLGQMPPADRDLWIVRTSFQPQDITMGSRASGGVICFTPGTRLMTPTGPRAIETLREGDLVSTRDNGPQEVLWTGHRRMTGARLFAMPHLRPIRIRASAFGIGQPEGDLLVSPQHRMLLRGRAAASLFNADEVLVMAEGLINDHSIVVDHALREVTYVHVLLPRHQIVWANGIETESFHPSNTALDTVDAAQRAALLQALPGLEADPQAYGDYARRNLSASEAAILRHEIGA
jgi:hypothetical protein